MSLCKNCETTVGEDNIKDGFIICFECGYALHSNGLDVCISDKSDWNTNYNYSKITDVSFDYNNNIISSKDRHLNTILKELESLNVPNHVKQNSFHLYKRVYDIMSNSNTIKRCTLRQGLKAACIYYTFKQLKNPIEKKEVAKICATTNKTVTKGCNYFLDVMGDDFIKMENYNTLDFIPKYCNLLNASSELQNIIKQVIIYIQSQDPTFIELSPPSVVCTCIYYIKNLLSLDLDISHIHEISGISVNRIKKNIPKIKVHENYILKLFGKNKTF